MRNIYGFSDSDIAAVKVDSQKRKNSKEKTLNESFYEMCRGYSLKGELKQNLEIFLRRIEELRKIRNNCLNINEEKVQSIRDELNNESIVKVLR